MPLIFNKKTIFLIFLLAVGFAVIGWPQAAKEAEETAEVWIKAFSGEEGDTLEADDYGYSVQQTADGGYIVAGYTTQPSFEAPPTEALLIKINSQGNKEWKRIFSGRDDCDEAHSVQQTTDGGYIVAGETQSRVCLMKTDKEGKAYCGGDCWVKSFGSGNAYSVQQTADGGYIVAGNTYFFGAGAYDLWLIKTDQKGETCDYQTNGNCNIDEHQWVKTFGGTDYDHGYSVQQTTDGGYIVAGYTYSFGAGAYDFWLIKTDSNGNKQWDKTFGGTGYDYGYSVQQTADLGYIAAGYTGSFGDGSSDWLIKTDQNGETCDYKDTNGNCSDSTVKWVKTFGGDTARSVQQTKDGGYIVAGYKDSGFWLIKIDSNVNKTWDKIFADSNEARSVQQTKDGGYIVAGDTTSFGAGDSDILLIKTDSNPVLSPTVGFYAVPIRGNTPLSVRFTNKTTGSAPFTYKWNFGDGGTSIEENPTHIYQNAGSYNVSLTAVNSFNLAVQERLNYITGLQLPNNYFVFGRDMNDEAYSVQQTKDGGYIVAGDTEVGTRGYKDILLLKTNSQGNEEWEKRFGGDTARSVQQTTDGGYIVAGQKYSNFLLIKTDKDGETCGYRFGDCYVSVNQWVKTFGGTDDEAAYSVQQTTDGGYIVAGGTASFGAGTYDLWLIKTDQKGKTCDYKANGNCNLDEHQWAKTLGGTNGNTARSVQQTADGGYIVAGDADSFGAVGTDFLLIKTDSNGNEQWHKTFDGTDYDYGYSVQQTADGGYIFTGHSFDGGSWLIKTDKDGNADCGGDCWVKTFGDGKAYSVQQTDDLGYIVAGYTSSFGAGTYDFWLIKTDQKGETCDYKTNGNCNIDEHQWVKTFGGTDFDAASSVQQTTDGGYIVAGYTDTNLPAFYGNDFLLVKIDENGLSPGDCPPEFIKVDLNSNDVIDLGDLLAVVEHWAETGSSAFIPEDVNKDGAVNLSDLLEIINQWAKECK